MIKLGIEGFIIQKTKAKRVCESCHKDIPKGILCAAEFVPNPYEGDGTLSIPPKRNSHHLSCFRNKVQLYTKASMKRIWAFDDDAHSRLITAINAKD